MELVSTLVQSPEYMKEASAELQLSDFSNRAARSLFAKMKQLYEKGETWNVMTLYEEFVDPTKVSSVLYHVGELGAFRVTKKMTQGIKQKAIGRTIYKELWTLMKENAESLDRSMVVAKGINFFSQLSQRLSFTELTKGDIINKHKVLMRRRYSGEIIGISTGFFDLDAILGQGLQKKDLVIIGARPSVGKTSFSLSLAHNIAQQKKFKVLYFTLEMDDEEVMDRLLAFQTGQPVTSIVRGQTKKEKLKEAYLKLSEMPLTVRYLPKATTADIYSIAAKEKAMNGLDVLIVDYLGLLGDESERGENDVMRIGRITKGLRAAAQMLDVAMVVPHQLNRKIEQRSKKEQETPLLSDLRDSGHIEQDADVIMFLSRDFLGDNADHATLRIGKHRTGQTGKIDLHFNQLTTRFESA